MMVCVHNAHSASKGSFMCGTSDLAAERHFQLNNGDISSVCNECTSSACSDLDSIGFVCNMSEIGTLGTWQRCSSAAVSDNVLSLWTRARWNVEVSDVVLSFSHGSTSRQTAEHLTWRQIYCKKWQIYWLMLDDSQSPVICKVSDM